MDMGALAELGGLVLGLFLTLAILSYVIGDNPLYRIALHILVGASAAFAVVVAVRDVIGPLVQSLVTRTPSSDGLFWLIPLILSLFLLLKLFRRTAWFGNNSMAVLIGIGAAVGLAGAITGTLLPQILVQYDQGWLAFVIAVLTILTLSYFFFSGQKSLDGRVSMPKWYPLTAGAGRVVLTITLAGLFAAVINTSLVLLIQRIAFYSSEISRLVELLFS